MTTEIDITRDLLPRHVATFATIANLGSRHGPGRWVIVGGLMVMLVGREHNARSPRSEGTKDADVLVDIVTHPAILEDVANFLLTSESYTLADPVGDESKAARCTFLSQWAMIDLLCPDDTPEGQLTLQNQNVASIAIPGGRRALETAREVSLYYSDDYPDAVAYVPTLPGAIAVKSAAALDDRTSGSPRHIEDVGFLLSIDTVDPVEVRGAFNDNDLELLARLGPSVRDATSPMWSNLDRTQRQAALAAHEFYTA